MKEPKPKSDVIAGDKPPQQAAVTLAWVPVEVLKKYASKKPLHRQPPRPSK
jgi:hypothetical protein